MNVKRDIKQLISIILPFPHKYDLRNQTRSMMKRVIDSVEYFTEISINDNARSDGFILDGQLIEDMEEVSKSTLST